MIRIEEHLVTIPRFNELAAMVITETQEYNEATSDYMLEYGMSSALSSITGMSLTVRKGGDGVYEVIDTKRPSVFVDYPEPKGPPMKEVEEFCNAL